MGVEPNLTQRGAGVILAPRRARTESRSACRWSVALATLVAGVALVGPRRVVVAGPSMEPTLRAEDRLLAVRALRVRVGDVVALRAPGDEQRVLVKRVEALVPEGVVVLGDNRAASTDSRSFGPVPATSVLGRVVRCYAPAERAGPVR